MNVSLSQFSRFAIVALMLFMQSATIAHAVEHDENEHTEHCLAFATAEQSANTPQEHRLPLSDAVNHPVWQTAKPLVVLTKRLHSLSRAPPITI